LPPQGLPGEAPPIGKVLIQPYPAASLLSTAEELGHFFLAHLKQGKYGGRILLQPATLSLMHQTSWTMPPQAQGVAYGLFESWTNGRHVLFHTGDSGHHGIFWLLPKVQLGLYVGCAADARIAFEVREKLIHALLDKYFPATVQEQSLTNSAALSPSGFYVSVSVNPYSFGKSRGLMSQVRVAQLNQQELRLQPNGLPEMTAVAVADQLYRTSKDATLAFAADGRMGA